MSITIHPHLVRRQTAVSSLTVDEARSIDLFNEKARMLKEGKREQCHIPLAKFTMDAQGACLRFEGNTPARSSVEVLATRYRFFFADKEPTHAFKIFNLLYKKAEDPWARNYIAFLRAQLNSFLNDCSISSKIGFPIKNKEIIDLWFNAEIFHIDQPKRERLAEINRHVSDEASLFQLNTALRLCTSNIEALFHITHQTNPVHLFIYTPNHHFGKTNSVSGGEIC